VALVAETIGHPLKHHAVRTHENNKLTIVGDSMNPKSSKPVIVCAFGILAAFFMPWIQFLGAGISGYNLGQLGSYGNYFWVIPILAGATILISFSGINNRVIGFITGFVPLGAILYGLLKLAGNRDNADMVLRLAGQVLSIGGWLTIIFSIAIIIVAAKKDNPSQSQVSENISQARPTIGSILQSNNYDIGNWVKKHKRILGYFAVGLVSVLIILLILNKTIWSVENKAQEFIDAGMYEQARIILDEEIQKDPSNASLHYQLGKTFLAVDNIYAAAQSFERAIRIKPSIGDKIGSAYLKEGMKSLKSNNSQRANNFFTLCIKYDPSKKSEIVESLIQAINENLTQNNITNAYSYAQACTSFDANASNIISEKAFSIAKHNVNSFNDSYYIIALGEFSISYNRSLGNEFGTLLKDFIDKYKSTIDQYALANLCQKAAFWNPALKNEMAELIYQKAKSELSKSEFNENIIESLLNSATAIDVELKANASKLVWEKLSSLLANLKELGQSRFLTMLNLCNSYGTTVEISNTDKYQFAIALKNYVDGNKELAIPVFLKLSKNPNSLEGNLSNQIISPPRIGDINFDSSPFLFKGTWSYFGGSGLSINLTKVKITNSSINIFFSMKNNGGRKDCLIFAPKNINERFGSHCEKLYILDDNGKKFYSYNGFIGGNPEKYNSCTNKICFNPGEDLILSAEFPMISPGATTIKFVSPNPDNAGHQSEWWWNSIKLKNGPFE